MPSEGRGLLRLLCAGRRRHQGLQTSSHPPGAALSWTYVRIDRTAAPRGGGPWSRVSAHRATRAAVAARARGRQPAAIEVLRRRDAWPGCRRPGGRARRSQRRPGCSTTPGRLPRATPGGAGPRRAGPDRNSPASRPELVADRARRPRGVAAELEDQWPREVAQVRPELGGDGRRLLASAAQRGPGLRERCRASRYAARGLSMPRRHHARTRLACRPSALGDRSARRHQSGRASP